MAMLAQISPSDRPCPVNSFPIYFPQTDTSKLSPFSRSIAKSIINGQEIQFLSVEDIDCSKTPYYNLTEIPLPGYTPIENLNDLSITPIMKMWDLLSGQQSNSITQEKLKNRFTELISQWHVECGSTSSISKVISCPAYLKIIAIGPDVLPLIFHQLESEGDEPDIWFWALQLLTDNNPVPIDAQGDLKLMSKIWLEWAHDSGYAW